MCVKQIDNCHLNATCINSLGSFECQCKNGFEGNGTVCKDVNECSAGTHNCHYYATCYNLISSFQCSCNKGYNGNGTVCKDLNECSLGTQ